MRPSRNFGNFAWTQHSPCIGCIRKYEHKCACKAFYHFDSGTDKAIQLRYPPAHFSTTSILDLPVELRNQIYGLLFTDSDAICDDWWQPCLSFTTCQIRLEVLPLFYALSHFSIQVGLGHNGELADAKKARCWVLSLDDKNIGCLRKVSVHAKVPIGRLSMQNLRYDLEIGRDGKVACSSDIDPTLWMWESLKTYSLPLACAIEGLEKDISGRRWSRETFLNALGGLRKLRAKAVMLRRQRHPANIR
ncbi:hypothetical protein LTR95_000567 [Oleoguttula sp. CCFEE 5521]